MPYTKEQLEQRFNELPRDIQLAMIAVDSTRVIVALKKKFGLSEQQAINLGDETGLLMLGFTHPKDFVGKLTERTQLPREKVLEIVNEINARIFHPIRESLKQIHGLPHSEEQEEGGEQIGPPSQILAKAGEERPLVAPVPMEEIKNLEEAREKMILEEIHGQKMSRLTRAPKEEIHVEGELLDEPAPGEKPKEAPKQYHKGDPYRESL